MEMINAVGMACPLPVIETKKALARLTRGTVQVLVDNITACENLEKMAKQMAHVFAMEKRSDTLFAVTITVNTTKQPANTSTNTPALVAAELAAQSRATQEQHGLVVAIGRDKMGSGNDDLGKILIKGFIFSLANLPVPPRCIIFFNSGVLLTVSGANTLDDLKTLLQKGTTVLVCGTCADFYSCKDKVAAGEITNMYSIVEQLSTASNVINI